MYKFLFILFTIRLYARFNNIFNEEVNNIASSANDNKRIQS